MCVPCRQYTPVGNERLLPFDNCRHPGVESIVLWRIVSIGCCPKVSPKSVAARRTSLQTVELSPRCDATGCSEDLSITYFRISKRWDRFLANLLGETLVQ